MPYSTYKKANSIVHPTVPSALVVLFLLFVNFSFEI